MFNITQRFIRTLALTAVFMVLLLPLQRVIAFNIDGGSDYAVLFEGGGGNHLSFNNGTISGNIGLGDPAGPAQNPQLQLSGGAANTIVDGDVRFAGAVNVAGTAGVDYTQTAGHTITGNNVAVTSALNSLNTLSSTLGGESGTSLAINVGNGGNQTVNASTGTFNGGDSVFTLSSMNFVNGATLTINGDGTHDVVLNINMNVSFGGHIVLTGGLTSDRVLFNMIGGANLSGGHTLTISTNGAIVTGTFLDPNGTMQINHSELDGRLFGGDSHDFMIVSGANIFAPPGMAPDGGSALALLGIALVGIEGARRLIHARAGERRNGVKSKRQVAQMRSSFGSEMNSLDESQQ
jgi:hypothetical protein